MSRPPIRSLSGPIILSSVAVVLSGALLVGWIWVILKNLELTEQYVQNTWLLVGGVLSFAAIMTVLVLFSVFLAREILEVRRQTSFMDSVTHELRSPLASLRLLLETLSRSEISNEQRTELREMMLEDVERLSAFVDDILEASKLAHGMSSQAWGEVAIREMIERCVGTMHRRHKMEKGQVRVEIDGDPRVETDPTALEIIIKNLLDNAVKYSGPDRAIVVRSVVRPSGMVTIEVHDNGIGIPPRALKRVTDRFYRVPDENVRARRGTGLGLFVVSALTRNIGGKLVIQSGGVGRGTTASISLPRKKARP